MVSMAIFAKINCVKVVSAISNSNHIDVLEMDAASKTGVDDVRDLDRIFKIWSYYS